jgi:hypothetical protein
MKQLLQVTSRSIKDFDESQRVLSEKLGITYTPLDGKVIEAFSHDPAGVTGHLRNARGWRAVEEIHNRLSSQRQILHSFIASFSGSTKASCLPKKGIYEDAMALLSERTEKLQSQRSVLASRSGEASELLAHVKRIRDELKPEFDDTSRHTSANYPEVN